MDMIQVALTIAPLLDGVPGENDKRQSYEARIEYAPNDTPSLSVQLAPKDKPTCVVPKALFTEIRQGFGDSTETHRTYCDGKAGTTMLYANSLSLAIARILVSVYPDYDNRLVPVLVTLRKDAGPGFSVQTTMPLSFDDPEGFGRDAKMSILDNFQNQEPPPEPALRAATPTMEWLPNSDKSEVTGDVRAEESEDPTLPLIVSEVPERKIDIDPTEADFNAHLFTATDSIAKYKALALAAKRVLDEGEVVVIVGDHPGTLGNALASMGVSSVGIDPKNTPMTIRHPGGGIRTLVSGEVRVANPEELLPEEWGLVIVDTSADNESADAATARNCNLAMSYAEKSPVIFQTRTVPMLKEYTVKMLDLPGHNISACEAYMAIGHDDADCSGWDDMAWATLKFGSLTGPMFATMHRGGPWKTYFDQGTRGAIIPREHWYTFVLGRWWTAAVSPGRDPILRAFEDNHDPFTLLASISIQMAGLGTDERRRLAHLFDPESVVDAVGVPTDAVRTHPDMFSVMAGRYEELLKECVPCAEEAPEALIRLMGNAKHGILLQRLSQVRATAGATPLLAKCKRVLPYESMAALASSTVYKGVFMWLRLARTLIGKTMHSWELQHMLWALTCFGNVQEKAAYMALVILEMTQQGPASRAPVKRGKAGEKAFGMLEHRLSDLDIKGRYYMLDTVFRDAALDRPNKKKRKTDQEHRPPSSSSSMAPPPTVSYATSGAPSFSSGSRSGSLTYVGSEFAGFIR